MAGNHKETVEGMQLKNRVEESWWWLALAFVSSNKSSWVLGLIIRLPNCLYAIFAAPVFFLLILATASLNYILISPAIKMQFQACTELNANFNSFTLDLSFYNTFLVLTKEISLVYIQNVDPKILIPAI